MNIKTAILMNFCVQLFSRLKKVSTIIFGSQSQQPGIFKTTVQKK
jgi:hypothetical protein